MTIADDGIGLRKMQYRAEVAGGTLRFESERGSGARPPQPSYGAIETGLV